MVRNPNEGTLWFRLWMALFVVINIAATILYLNLQSLRPVVAMAPWSLVHAVLLCLISPLARGDEK